MRPIIRNIATAIVVFTLASCASTPKISLLPETKSTIKTIALIETPEPKQYQMIPPQNVATSALFIFGAIGGAIVGGIEVTREKNATKKFTEAISVHNPKLCTTMLDKLEIGLERKGYIVNRVPMPPTIEDGKNLDFSAIEGQFDAYLVVTLDGGYSAFSHKPIPSMRSSVQLYNGEGTKLLFSDSYYYGSKRAAGKSIHIEPDPQYVLDSLSNLYEDVQIAHDGMKSGAILFSEHTIAAL